MSDVELLQRMAAHPMYVTNRTRGRSIHYRTAERLAREGLCVCSPWLSTRRRAWITPKGREVAGVPELPL